MMRVLFLCLSCLCLGAFAASPSERDSEFKIDSDLVNKLFRNTTSDVGVNVGHASAGILVSPVISLFSADSFSLTNNYWEVVYGDSMGTLPRFLLDISTPVGFASGFEFFLGGQFGYGSKEAAFTSRKVGGGQTYRDMIKIHCVPLAATARLDYEIPGVRFIKPSLTAGVGAQWLYQAGKLDGVEQGFWVPFYQFGGALVLFESLHSTDDWFGGLRLGGSVQRSFASEQSIRGWSLDTSVIFAL